MATDDELRTEAKRLANLSTEQDHREEAVYQLLQQRQQSNEAREALIDLDQKFLGSMFPNNSLIGG